MFFFSTTHFGFWQYQSISTYENEEELYKIKVVLYFLTTTKQIIFENLKIIFSAIYIYYGFDIYNNFILTSSPGRK